MMIVKIYGKRTEYHLISNDDKFTNIIGVPDMTTDNVKFLFHVASKQLTGDIYSFDQFVEINKVLKKFINDFPEVGY